MKKLKVNTGRKYEIIIDRGIINHCGEYIKKVSSPTRIAVVTDSNVHALYSQSVITVSYTHLTLPTKRIV